MIARLLPYALVLLAAVIMAASQLLLRGGLVDGGPVRLDGPAALIALAARVLGSPRLLFGYALSLISSLAWLVALARLEVSVAQPLLNAAVSIVLFAGAAAFLGERPTPGRWCGVALIVAGAALVARR